MKKVTEKVKVTNRVSIITLILNTALFLFKLLAGIIGNSGAMVSDAVHSLSDSMTTVVVMVGVNISEKEPDKEHPYGHQRIEALVAILMAIALFFTAYGIGKAGVENIIKVMQGETIPVPTLLPLIAAIISIVLNEGLYWYAHINSKKIDSAAMQADAWHHRSDALSSVGSLIGIGGAIIGFPVFDPIASVIICVMIVWVGVKICKTGINQLIDRAADESTQQKIREVVEQTPGVIRVDEMKTRLHSNFLYVDLEICVKEDLNVKAAHAIAEQVHDNVEAACSNVLHCMVHVNPLE